LTIVCRYGSIRQRTAKSRRSDSIFSGCGRFLLSVAGFNPAAAAKLKCQRNLVQFENAKLPNNACLETAKVMQAESVKSAHPLFDLTFVKNSPSHSDLSLGSALRILHHFTNQKNSSNLSGGTVYV
jgi:hypothetical protein